MVSAMKIADIKSEAPFRVRVNRSGRRTFSREYKLEIVQECSVPGASVAGVALAHRVNANQVRKWIVQHRARRLCPNAGVPPVLLPVTLERASRPTVLAHSESGSNPALRCAAGVIEIELDRAHIRVRGAADAAALRIVLDALAKR
jgi:transposase